MSTGNNNTCKLKSEKIKNSKEDSNCNTEENKIRFNNSHNNTPIPLNSTLEIGIKEMKELYQLKLKEIDQLNKEILQRDNNNKGDQSSTSSINELNLKKNKQHKEEKGTNAQLKQELIKLQDEYQREVQSILQQSDSKVIVIKDEINRLQDELELYNDEKKYISKKEHERIIFELMQKQQLELEPFEREIAELEQYLSDIYPEIGNRDLTHPSSYFNDNQIQEESSPNVISLSKANKVINDDTEPDITINNNLYTETVSRFTENLSIDENYNHENIHYNDENDNNKKINCFVNRINHPSK